MFELNRSSDIPKIVWGFMGIFEMVYKASTFKKSSNKNRWFIVVNFYVSYFWNSHFGSHLLFQNCILCSGLKETSRFFSFVNHVSSHQDELWPGAFSSLTVLLSKCINCSALSANSGNQNEYSAVEVGCFLDAAGIVDVQLVRSVCRVRKWCRRWRRPQQFRSRFRRPFAR